MAYWTRFGRDDEYDTIMVLVIKKEAAGRIAQVMIIDSDCATFGSVNDCGNMICTESRNLGITIYDDAQLGKGLNIEAIHLWDS